MLAMILHRLLEVFARLSGCCTIGFDYARRFGSSRSRLFLNFAFRNICIAQDHFQIGMQACCSGTRIVCHLAETFPEYYPARLSYEWRTHQDSELGKSTLQFRHRKATKDNPPRVVGSRGVIFQLWITFVLRPSKVGSVTSSCTYGPGSMVMSSPSKASSTRLTPVLLTLSRRGFDYYFP